MKKILVPAHLLALGWVASSLGAIAMVPNLTLATGVALGLVVGALVWAATTLPHSSHGEAHTCSPRDVS